MDSSRESSVEPDGDSYSQIVKACDRVRVLVQEHVDLEVASERNFFGVHTEICRLYRDASGIISDRIDPFYSRDPLQSCAWSQTETLVNGVIFPHSAATARSNLSRLEKSKRTVVTEDPRHVTMNPVERSVERQLLDSPDPCAVNQCEYICMESASLHRGIYAQSSDTLCGCRSWTQVRM